MAKKNVVKPSDTSNANNEDDKSSNMTGRPNWILLALVIVVLWAAMWAAGRKGRVRTEDSVSPPLKTASTGKKEKISDVPVDEQFAQALKNRGKVLAIGPSAMDMKAVGIEIVKADSIPDLSKLLEGTDVNAVTDALASAGIQNLIIDPSVTVQNPLPQNTVKNRLALGRPSGRLSAKLMSQKLFYYKMEDPPLQFPESFKKKLIEAARAGMGGKPFSAGEESPIAKDPANWNLILTVRPMQSSHLSYHTATGGNPLKVAYKTGEKARAYFQKRESFTQKFGSVDDALEKILTLEMEVLFDEGSFIGPKDPIFMWRIIDPGIHGIRMSIDNRLHFLPPWYSVAANFRTVNNLLDRVSETLGRQDKNYWRKPETVIDRFRTAHWREKSPGGPIQDLYRFSPTMPSNRDVTKENLVKSLVGLNDWIADNTKPDGRHIYRYFPTKDEENDEYNMVRHCLGAFSMALTEEFAPNPKYKKAADLGMSYIEKHIRWGGHPRKRDGTIDTSLKKWMGKPIPGSDVAIIDFPEPPNNDWSSKMGAVAVAILGYTQYKRVGWDLGPEREKVLKGLANFLLYMQDEEKGDFHHYYVAPDSSYYNTRNSIYPGEILYAVARLYGETKDEKYRQTFKQSMVTNLNWFKEQLAMALPDGTFEEEQRKNLVQFQPWIAMAMDEMYRYDPDPAYVEASNFVSLWILDQFQFDETRAFFPDYLGGYMKVLDELPAMHSFVYTEGVAASYDLARRAKEPADVINKLRKGALLTARFLMQQQVRPGENDFYYPNPKKAAGAVRYCMNHNKQRIDYTYHALSSVYRILKAATDEDYAFIQSLPMPSAW